MTDAVIQPLEVFILDANFKRLTGSIPYDSLTWHRRYYGVGEFQMQVRSSLYDPSWCYVYADARPETGIIQKVEFDDTTEGPANGEDTIIISGFFLEELLNRLVFLVEESETEEIEHEYVVPKPTNVMRFPTPTYYQDDEGNYYVKFNGGQWNNCMTGEGYRYESNPEFFDSLTEADVQPGKGIHQLTFHYGPGVWPGGESYDWVSSIWSTIYSYVSEGGQLTIIDQRDNTEGTYEIVGDTSSGNILYKDTDGSVKWVNGAVEGFENTYRRRKQSWEFLKSQEGIEYDENGNAIIRWTEYREVEGPWMLRTDLDDVNTPQDNVQWVLKMAEKIFQGGFIYDKVGFSGETKTISPSLTRIGDFFYRELQSVEASLRVMYNFESNQTVFQLWRGLDRTQDNGGQTPVETASVMAAPMAASAPAVASSIGPVLPSGYTQLEYAESSGTQYIDTGFRPDSDTRVIGEFMVLSSGPTVGYVFGCRGETQEQFRDRYGILYNGEFRSDYGEGNGPYFTNVVADKRYTFDKNKATCTIGSETVTNTAATFSSPRNMFLFGVNESVGSASAPDHGLAARIYSLDVYDDGMRVRSFVPAKRNLDNVVGMYDTISGTFYENIGTGSFAAGPSVSSDTYTQVEYIESSGTQYVDTGYKPGSSTRVVASIDYTGSQDGNFALFGGRNGNKSATFTVFSIDGSVRTDFYNDQRDTEFPVSDVETIDKDGNVTTLNGTDQTTDVDGEFRSNYTLAIFAVNTAGTFGLLSSMRVSSFDIYDDQTIVMSFIPVKRDSDGVAGLYDSISGEFYGNSGSGSFVAGPEVQIADSLTYDPNGGTGYMDPTEGYVGGSVTVAANSFTYSDHTFVTWNTAADGSGTDYAPLSQYVLTAGADVLYAQWEEVEQPPTPTPTTGGAPWAVFSDTWGTLYGYKASHDESNYRNKCYVMYETDEPVWDETGHVAVEKVAETEQQEDDYGNVTTVITGYHWTTKTQKLRGMSIVRLDDERPDSEVWSDRRGDSPDFMEDADFGDFETEDDVPDYEFTKDDFDRWLQSLDSDAETMLKTDYTDVDNLDTGTIATMRYFYDFDLGDKVDIAVEAIGMSKTARITEVEEVYESGSADIRLTMGEELLTTSKKSLLI